MPPKRVAPPKAAPASKTRITKKSGEPAVDTRVSARTEKMATGTLAAIAAKSASVTNTKAIPKNIPVTKKTSAIRKPATPTTKTAAALSRKRKATEESDEASTRKGAKATPISVKRTKTAAPSKKAQKKTVAPITKAAAAAKRASAKPRATTNKSTPVTGKRKSTEDPAEAPKNKKVKMTGNVSTKKSGPAKKVPKKLAAPKKPVAPRKVAIPKPKKAATILNEVPTKRLDIYVFGEGTAGELGLGAMKFEGKKPTEVKRPRLNHLLSAEKVGVVALAVGGMHCVALTHDHRLLSWGVNDNGALGRPTDAGKMVEIPKDGSDSDSESDDEDSGLNPSECEPREIDMNHFPEGTKFAQLIACDSASFVVTQEGLVYGWGTFRDSDGLLGFRKAGDTQLTPMLIPELKGVVKLAAGVNHILALTNKGKVFAWGAGDTNQLARRVVQRTAHVALIPREFGLKGVTTVIGSGDFHSFAVNKDGTVRAWGLNSYGECLLPKDGPGDNDIIGVPTKLDKLSGFAIKEITGGAHHSIAVTDDGKVLTWGRMEDGEGGILPSAYPEGALYFDEAGRPRMAIEPCVVPIGNVECVASGPEDCLAVTKEGQAYSWGFSENYQTGQGPAGVVTEATLLENSAVKGKKLCGVGAGGQFSVLYAGHEETSLADS